MTPIGPELSDLLRDRAEKVVGHCEAGDWRVAPRQGVLRVIEADDLTSSKTTRTSRYSSAQAAPCLGDSRPGA